MDIHKNARLTPLGRERLVNMVVGGQTPQAASDAVGVCPRTVRKWVKRYQAEGLAGLQDRSSRPHRLHQPTPQSVIDRIESLRRQRRPGKEIAVTVGVLMCVVLGPLLVFAPQLAQAKRTGLREYGTLAERYVREFDAKWLRGGAPADEPFVGSSDIQSLADLGNSFEVVRTMRIAPVTKETVLQLVVATIAPIVPLALTMMPLEELLKTLLGVVF